MTTEQNKAVMRSFYDYFDKGDLDGCFTVLSHDLRAYHGGMPGSMDRDAFREFGAVFLAAFSDAKHTVHDQIAEGDRVATRGTWSAVHSGTFNGIPATGRRVSIDIQNFDRVVGGQIVEHRAYFDLAGLIAQVAPASAAA
jgi:steroid delta-isomerase-like uncharacterized protein